MRTALLLTCLATMTVGQMQQQATVSFCVSGNGATINGTVFFPSMTICGTFEIGGLVGTFCCPMAQGYPGYWRGEVTVGGVLYRFGITINDTTDQMFNAWWWIPEVSTAAHRML